MYSYPKGGKLISGPSIRLAEELARAFGNMSYGLRELSQANGESVMEAFCVDYESNLRSTKIFTVPHERYTRKGVTKLKDPRDIYEHCANQGARRLRGCILSVVPGDVTSMAVDSCKETIARGDGKLSLQDRIIKMALAFDGLGVKKEDLEGYLGYKIESCTTNDLVDLISIFTTIKDNISTRGTFFKQYAIDTDKSKELNEKLNKKEKKNVGKKAV